MAPDSAARMNDIAHPSLSSAPSAYATTLVCSLASDTSRIARRRSAMR